MKATIYGWTMQTDDTGKVVRCLDDGTYPFERMSPKYGCCFNNVSGCYTPAQLRYRMKRGNIKWS